MGFANHGWHHEPHSPVKNSMCKRWDTLKRLVYGNGYRQGKREHAVSDSVSRTVLGYGNIGEYGTRGSVRQSPVCRIPKPGAMTQEVQETLRDQDSLRKWTVSQPAVGGPDIRMGRQVTPRVRGLPATVPLSEYLLVSILTLTNTSNTSEALCG